MSLSLSLSHYSQNLFISVQSFHLIFVDGNLPRQATIAMRPRRRGEIISTPLRFAAPCLNSASAITEQTILIRTPCQLPTAVGDTQERRRTLPSTTQRRPKQLENYYGTQRQFGTQKAKRALWPKLGGGRIGRFWREILRVITKENISSRFLFDSSLHLNSLLGMLMEVVLASINQLILCNTHFQLIWWFLWAIQIRMSAKLIFSSQQD
jgi:hypothetical protein